MATFLRVGSLLKSCNFIQNTVISDSILSARILTNVQFVRGRRRTSKPPGWFVKRGTDSGLYKSELTRENKAFIDEVTKSRYTQEELAHVPSPLKDGPWKRNEWNKKSMRTGVLALKIGVLPQYKKDGTKILLTLLQVIDNHVINYTPPEVFQESKGFKEEWMRNTYGSLVVGALSSDPQSFSAKYCGLFKQSGVPPKRKLTRYLITPDCALQPGTPLTAMHFRVGDYVDCQAKTIGHGFQGVIKRWGFKGGPKSHGPTKFQRRPGTIGSGRAMSKVSKGKKMPGHMGMERRTMKGLKIWRINTKYNVLYVNGGNLPGPNHCYVRVFDSQLQYRCLERNANPPAIPTFYPDLDVTEPIPEEIFDNDLYQYTESSITYEDEAK